MLATIQITRVNLPSSGSSSPHKFLSIGSPIYEEGKRNVIETNFFVHLYQRLSAIHRTHHHIEGDYTRPKGAYPSHRDGNPTER